MKTHILVLITVVSLFGILNYSCNKDENTTTEVFSGNSGTFIDKRNDQTYS